MSVAATGRRWDLGPLVVAGLGLFATGVFLSYTATGYLVTPGVTDSGPVEVAIELIEICLFLVLGGTTLLFAVRLADSSFTADQRLAVARTTALGALFTVAVAGVVILTRSLEADPITPAVAVEVATLGLLVGTIGGYRVGIALARANRNAERARSQRDAVLFMNDLLRHNVLNAMQVVLAQASFVREGTVDPTEAAETISTRSEQVVDRVRKVKLLADAVGDTSPAVPVSFSDAVAAAVARARTDHEDARFEVDAEPDVTVLAGPLVEEVVTALVENAVEHHDGEVPTVAVSLSTQGSVARLTVVDDGPGIDRDEVADAFSRRDGDGGLDGDSLGLSLVGTLVERYGGTVRLEPSDPRGTRAVVELPLA